MAHVLNISGVGWGKEREGRSEEQTWNRHEEVWSAVSGHFPGGLGTEISGAPSPLVPCEPDPNYQDRAEEREQSLSPGSTNVPSFLCPILVPWGIDYFFLTGAELQRASGANDFLC